MADNTFNANSKAADAVPQTETHDLLDMANKASPKPLEPASPSPFPEDAENQASQGWKTLGKGLFDYLQNQYNQSGQTIHQALQGDPATNPQARAALESLGEQAAMSTVGGEAPKPELPRGYTFAHDPSSPNPAFAHRILNSEGQIAGLGRTPEKALEDLYRVQPDLKPRTKPTLPEGYELIPSYNSEGLQGYSVYDPSGEKVGMFSEDQAIKAAVAHSKGEEVRSSKLDKVTSIRPNAKLSPSAQDTIEKIKEKDLTFFDPSDFSQSFIAKDQHGEPIGHLGLDEDFRTQSIKVDPNNQNQGIASTLYQKALNKNGLLRSSHTNNQLAGGRGLWEKFQEENPYNVWQARDSETLEPLDYKVWQKDVNPKLRQKEIDLENQADQLREQINNIPKSTSYSQDIAFHNKEIDSSVSKLIEAKRILGRALGIDSTNPHILSESIIPKNLDSETKEIVDAARRTAQKYQDLIDFHYSELKDTRDKAKKATNPKLNELKQKLNNVVAQHQALNKKSGHTMFSAGGYVKGYANGGQVQPQDQTQAQPQQPSSQPDGATIYNFETNQWGTVPHDQVNDAIASGKFSFPKGQPVPAFNDQGQLGYIPPEQASQAFQNGYKYASPAAVNEYQLQQKYGEGLGNEAKAAALGFGSTLSFGAIPQALTQSGLADPEALRQIKERNPASYNIGSGAGIAAPFIGELGALGAGVRGVSELGGVISEAAARALPETSSLTGKILSNAMAKGAGSAVEGLAYGAGNLVTEQALGDPNLNAQSAMAQLGLSGVLGGTLGGILGAGEVAIPESIDAAQQALQKVRSAVLGEPGEGKLGDLIQNGYAKTAAFTSGKNESDILTALQNRGLFSSSPEDVEKFSTDFSKSLQDQYDSMVKASKDVFKDIRPGESEVLLSEAQPEAAQLAYSHVSEYLSDAIDRMSVEPEIYPPRYVRKLQMLRDRYLGKPGDIIGVGEEGLEGQTVTPREGAPSDPETIFSALNDLKHNLDKNIGYGKIPGAQDIDAQNAIKAIRLEIKNTLENPEIFGPAASRQAQFNNSFRDFDLSKEAFEKKFMVKTKTKTGSVKYKVDPVKVNSYLNQISDIRGAAKSEILDNFNNASSTYLDQIDKSYKNLPAQDFDKEAISGLADKSVKMQQEFAQKAEIQNAFKRLAEPSSLEVPGAIIAHQVGVPAPVIAAYSAFSNPFLTIQRLAKFEKLIQKTNSAITKGTKALFKAGTDRLEDTAAYLGAKASTNSLEDHDKKTDAINQLINNPQLLMEKLENSVDGLHSPAPNHASSLQNTSVQALNFLKSKIPVSAPETPLGSKVPLTKTDINKFNRYYDVVENPMLVFKQIKSGTLTTESVEALSAVYPDLYNKIKTQIFDHLSEIKNKTSVPYPLKLQLSLFMGKDMDNSTTPSSIMSSQIAQGAALQQQAQQNQALSGPSPVKPTQKALGKIDIASQKLTQMQATSQRKA